MPLRAPGIPTALALSLAAACGGPVHLETDTSGESSSGGVSGIDLTTTAAPTTGPAGSSGAADETTDADTSGSSGGASSTGDAASSTGDPGTLCERLGGMDDAGVPALAADALARVLADDRVNGYFLNVGVDQPALLACLEDQLGEAAGCDGVVYTCLDMQAAHAGLGVSAADFADFVADVSDALAAHRDQHPALTDEDVAGLLAGFAAAEADVVEDATSDATLYQRVGRKPGLLALVGDPDAAGSFVAEVAEDAAIGAFFADADFARLRTCLTRQLAAIDGPVLYGAEVTAPAGVDPGVGLDDPCRSMTAAHAGLMDAEMQFVTVDDFLAVMMALTTAMDGAGVDPADQVTIQAALEPLCPEIVAVADECPGNQVTVDVEANDLQLDLIPFDHKYTGALDSMACVALEVVDDGVNYVDRAQLTVGMDHTWIGDVTIKVVAPDQTLLTALSRPGDPDGALPDNSEDCCGDNSNFSAAAPFTLADAAVVVADKMGAMLGDAAVVCKDEVPPKNPCAWKPFPGQGPGMGFVDFHGKPAVGVWKVCFGDSGMGDFGKVDSVRLTLDKSKDPP